MIYRLTRALTVFISKIFFPAKVIGKEHIPKEGHFIIASNHRSNLDPVVLAICIPYRISFVAKESLFQKKFLGWYLPKLEAFPIRRNVSDFRAIREALRRIKKFRGTLIFPEGRRNAQEGEVQSGVGFLARKAGVPVIPVNISGTERMMPQGSKRFKRFRQRIRVVFGPAIIIDPKSSFHDISKKIVQEIKALE